MVDSISNTLFKRWRRENRTSAAQRQLIGSIDGVTINGFKCLSDECGQASNEHDLVVCMVYVDLNPGRAQTAKTPESSDYISVQQRIRQPEQPSISLLNFSDGDVGDQTPPMALSGYLSLGDWTAREAVHVKRGYVSESTPSILNRPRFDKTHSSDSMQLFRTAEIRALAPRHALGLLAKSLSRRWFRGASRCRAIFVESSHAKK